LGFAALGDHREGADMLTEISERLYYWKSARLERNTRAARLEDPEVLDVVTIAFNNPRMIDYQVRLLRKHLSDPHYHTIADNSSDRRSSEAIAQLCARDRTPYIRLPRNPFSGSMSHGAAMTWVYKNYVRKRGARYFGFLDHDIFPARPTSVLQHLGAQACYGHYQQRGRVWYLWGGFSFFDSSHVPQTMDFRSGVTNGEAVDTGGMNWGSLYSKIEKSGVRFPAHEYRSIRETDGSAQSDRIELIGDWLHVFNASGWMAVPDQEQRERMIESILANL
jgi:hypothetical protein